MIYSWLCRFKGSQKVHKGSQQNVNPLCEPYNRRNVLRISRLWVVCGRLCEAYVNPLKHTTCWYSKRLACFVNPYSNCIITSPRPSPKAREINQLAFLAWIIMKKNRENISMRGKAAKWKFLPFGQRNSFLRLYVYTSYADSKRSVSDRWLINDKAVNSSSLSSSPFGEGRGEAFRLISFSFLRIKKKSIDYFPSVNNSSIQSSIDAKKKINKAG